MPERIVSKPSTTAKWNRHTPNVLTMLRVVLVAPLVMLMWPNTSNGNLLALLVALIMLATDFLDGRIARRLGVISDFGRYIDPVADKVCVFAVAAVLSFVRGNLPGWLTLLIIMKDILILLGGMVIIRRGITIQADPPGKYTVTVVAATLLCYLMNADYAGDLLVLPTLFFILHSTYAYYKKFLDLTNRRSFRGWSQGVPALAATGILVWILWSNSIYSPAHRRDNRPHRVMSIAHRAAAAYGPENTKAAVVGALKMGVDMIEIDVRQTLDSVVVLMHDATIDRSTTGTGAVGTVTFHELRQADAGVKFGSGFRGEPIPSLEEILTTIDGKTNLLIEFKEGSRTYPGIEERVIRMLRKHNALGWCAIHSFSQQTLKLVKQIEPSISVFQLIIAELPGSPFTVDSGITLGGIGAYEGVDGINVHYLATTQKFVDRVHKRGMKVYCWTLDDPDLMRRLVRMGVDGIITDCPDRVNQIKRTIVDDDL